MNNRIKEKYGDYCEAFEISIEKIDYYYPKITDTLVTLSSTGISTNNYSHWKKQGLVDSYDNVENENRTWVRLNIFQYIWLKIIESMYSFGLPLYLIKSTKEFLFLDFAEHLRKDEKEIENIFKTESNYPSEKLEILKMGVHEFMKIESMPVEYKILATTLGFIIIDILYRNDQVSLVISNSIDGFNITTLSYKSIIDSNGLEAELLDKPHLQIPIRPLIEDFFNEPRNEKVAETYGFINLKEKKVIDAIRKNDFKEIIIRFENNDKEQMIIEQIIDADIRDQKAKEINRILGMNQYSEIILKSRNDKHIYIRNKTRL